MENYHKKLMTVTWERQLEWGSKIYAKRGQMKEVSFSIIFTFLGRPRSPLGERSFNLLLEIESLIFDPHPFL